MNLKDKICRFCGSTFKPTGRSQVYCSTKCSFIAKVTKTDKCWIWSAGIANDGYGVFGSHKSFRAHRVSYELFVGPIDDGLIVLHSCDNPACVNPSHLSLGTQSDNVHDMIRKGRRKLAVGSRCGSSKLTEDSVMEIKRLSSTGVGTMELSRMFGVERHAIQKIKSGTTWTHVDVTDRQE